MKSLVLKNWEFKVKKLDIRGDLEGIYEAYSKPSCYKVSSYNRLVNFALSLDNLEDYGVSGHNSCTYTFDIITKDYIIRFTKNNNYIMER